MVPSTLNIFQFLLQLLFVVLNPLLTNSQTQDFSNEIHKLMTQSELSSTFGSHHDQIPEYETAKVTLHHINKRHLALNQPDFDLLAVIETANTTLHLHLNRHNNIISKSFEIEIHHQNYTEVITSDQIAVPQCLFQGIVKNGGKAAVSTCHENGMIGLIILEANHFILKPIPSRLNKKIRASHIMYEKKDPHYCPHKFDTTMVAPEEKSKTEEEVENEIDGQNSRSKRASSTEKVVETAVFVDDVMYESIKKEFKTDTKTAVINVVFTMINAVQLLYNQPSLGRKFSFVLVRVEMITSASKGPNKAKGDIKEYLINFCKWQTKTNPGADTNKQHWDNAIMLSGLNLYQGSPSNHRVIGLAWVSGMCRPLYSCCINEGNNFETVFVITHELGHNLGMHHDGDSNSCSGNSHIMSPTLGPGKIRWSTCSKKYLDDFLRKSTASCMNDVGTVTEGLSHEAEKGLPGERFDIYDQCHKAFGTDYVPYAANKSPYDNLCRELWCYSKGYVKRAHPALDGSLCGRDKICKYGDCIADKRPAGQRAKSLKTKGKWSEEPTTTPSSFFGKVKNKAKEVWEKIKNWG